MSHAEELATLLSRQTDKPGDRSFVRRGVVTAVSSTSATVTIGAASVPSVPFYRHSAVKVGDVVDVLFDAGAPRIIGTLDAAPTELPQPIFLAPPGLAAATATGWTTFYTNNALLSLPFAYVMDVHVETLHGFSSADNMVTWGMLDEAGTSNILHKSATLAAVDKYEVNQRAGWRQSTSFRGRKQYSAGQTCGFRLRYYVNTGNVYADFSVKVSFHKP